MHSFYTKIVPGIDYIGNSGMFIAALVSLAFLSMVKYRIVKLVWHDQNMFSMASVNP